MAKAIDKIKDHRLLQPQRAMLRRHWGLLVGEPAERLEARGALLRGRRSGGSVAGRVGQSKPETMPNSLHEGGKEEGL